MTAGNNSAATGNDGNYTLKWLTMGIYTLTPSKEGYSFSPTSRSVNVIGDMSGQDFSATAATYSVSGTITSGGIGLAGVTVTAGGTIATSSSDGSYTLSGLAAGSYTLTPSKSGYSFSPTSRNVTVNGNVSGQDFSATAATYSVSGTITSNGSGLSGVTVTAGDTTATTGSDGSYTLSGMAAGSYTLTPSKSGYSFSPTSRSVTVSANVSGQDFSATSSSSAGLVQSITPAEGSGNQETRVTIRGSGFPTAPAPTARLSGSAGSFALTNSTVENAATFAATVPAGLPAGIYDLIVTVNDRTGTLPHAFTVLAQHPLITQVAPRSGFNDRATDLLVQGFNFIDGAVVTLGSTALATTRVNGTMLLATVPVDLPPATYDLTVTNPDGGQAQLTAAYTVLDAAGTNDDLFSSSDQFWVNPVTPHAQTPVEIGLFVQRSGGKMALEDVPVAFRRDAVNGPILGMASVPFLDPHNGIESTLPLEVTFADVGTFTLYAIIDPDNTVTETLDNNNVVSRTITIAPAAADRIVPVVEDIGINGGTTTTVTTLDVTLDIRANDPPPNASGVQSAHIIEYVYNEGAGRWVPVAQSGWMPYTQTPDSYAWSLLPLPGMHYVQVRAQDHASNSSIGTARQLINYEPPSDRIGRGQTRIYRYTVTAGQQLSVSLDVLSGDADLAIWSSAIDQSAWVSNQEGSADEQVIIPASAIVPGVYQVEVYGYTAAEYRLSTSFSANGAGLAAVENAGLAADKTVPVEPIVPVASMPDERAGSVPVTIQPTSSYAVYLPLTVR